MSGSSVGTHIGVKVVHTSEAAAQVAGNEHGIDTGHVDSYLYIQPRDTKDQDNTTNTTKITHIEV